MPVVDVAFHLQGNIIPADHGYHLFSAVSEIIPAIHGDEEIGLHPISGRLVGNRCLAITEKSNLTIRIASERIGQILPLAGKELRIGGHRIRVGVPHSRAIKPSEKLYSRLVIIKGFLEPEPFLEAAMRQMAELNIKGKLAFVDQPHIAKGNEGRPAGTRSPYLRRTLCIRGKEVVGFALRVTGLTPEDSVLLQEKGLGGRRRFGCGIFIPDRRMER